MRENFTLGAEIQQLQHQFEEIDSKQKLRNESLCQRRNLSEQK